MSGASRIIRINFEEYKKRIFHNSIAISAKKPHLIKKKQSQIVEGACQVFFKKGFHKASIREIASSCSMSMGQLYHYISCKDDVLFLVHQHMQQIWYEHLKNSGFERIDDPIQRLTQAIGKTLEFIANNKKLFQFIYMESKHLDKEHLASVLDIDDKNVVGFYRQLLLDVKKRDFTEKERDLAANLIAYLSVFLALRGWNLKKTNLKENTDFVTEFILGGLGIKSLKS